MSNELDGRNYAITKIALQGHALGIGDVKDVQRIEDRRGQEPASQLEKINEVSS